MKTVRVISAVPNLQGQGIDLTWQNPPVSDFPITRPLEGIRILRRERTFPLDQNDGTVIYDGPLTNHYSDLGLQPLTTYYYTIFTLDNTPAYYADTGAQTTAFSTLNYHLFERLYSLLPAVHQRNDVLSPSELAQYDQATLNALQALPTDLRGHGPLRRFFAATYPSIDLMRSFAEGLRQLHDIDRARPEFLILLGDWLGWDLDRSQPVYEQRNEVKAAPHLYRSVGSAPNLITFVERYTGWHAQVAEFMQNIARANHPPQLNIFSLFESGGVWRAVSDAATALGFGAGNDRAHGSAALPAVLVGNLSGPFSLLPGMEFAVTADDHLPVVVRFGDADFSDISVATAAEVADVLNRSLSEVVAIARLDGHLELRSESVGTGSAISLKAEANPAALVTLEGAPRGRLSALVDRDKRLRLFYAAYNPHPEAGDRPETSQLRFKSFRDLAWGDSQTIPAEAETDQTEPAAVELQGGSLLLAWVEAPDTPLERLRFRLGHPRPLQPASIIGSRPAPFDIPPGSTLLLRTHQGVPQQFVFRASDFADPHHATGLEVVNALNARLPGFTAALVGSAIVLATADVGQDVHLEIDLDLSTAAQALGFDISNATADGDWGDAITWDPPQDIPSAPTSTPGVPVQHRDLCCLLDATGIVWLFWAMHSAGTWQIVSTRWNGAAWTAMEVVASSPFGDREPCAVLDAANRLWLLWARRKVQMGVSNRAPEDDNWTLWRRSFSGVWNPEAEFLTSPAGRATDRQPAAVRLASGDLRVFFQTDRTGGTDLWSTTFTPPAGVPAAPSPVTAGPTSDQWPAPVVMSDGLLWLLFRSDRSISPSLVATRPLVQPDNRVTSPKPSPQVRSSAPASSVRMQDSGTAHRFAGTTSVCLNDAARNSRHSQWDDLLAYTPQGVQHEAVLRDEDLYTPGTIGLYLTQVVRTTPLSLQRVDRLLTVLKRFLPVNVRAVVILAPRLDSEIVYGELPDGTRVDIVEAYRDKFPYLENYPAVGEMTTAIMPGVLVLHSADFNPITPDDVSADPANPQTMRRRSYFPPLQ